MTDIITPSNAEQQRKIIESLKQIDEVEHPALKRCAETPCISEQDPEKFARQAYDRMFHRHSRS